MGNANRRKILCHSIRIFGTTQNNVEKFSLESFKLEFVRYRTRRARVALNFGPIISSVGCAALICVPSLREDSMLSREKFRKPFC